MARIVIHPGQMRVAAKQLLSVRTDLQAAVIVLRSRSPMLPPGQAVTAQYLKDRAAAVHRLEVLAEGLEEPARELRRRAGMVEESPLLHGASLAGLTKKQRNWLFPSGQQAINLKRKLAILARQLGVALPEGFNPRAPVTGQAARQLLRMINVRLGGQAVGAFNVAIRRRLRAIHLRTEWQALLEYPGNNAGDQRLACWLAANARSAGVSPLLPVMCAIPESGIGNLNHGDRDSVGFFQIRVSIHPAPAGFGAASGKKQSGDWWVRHPEAQMAWFTQTALASARGSPSRNVNTTDPERLGNWAVDIERCAAQYEYKYRASYDRAKKLVDRCQQLQGPASAQPGAGGGDTSGGGTYLYPRGEVAVLLKHKLQILARRSGVTVPASFDPDSPRVGASARALIRRLQKKLGLQQSGGFDIHLRRLLKPIEWAPPGSPYASRLLQVARRELPFGAGHAWRYQSYSGMSGAWCASFVSWALKQAGDPTPYVSASVGHWVSTARAGDRGLTIVSAADARPGDLVAYDWDGGGDFYGKSHIGILTGGDSPRFQTIHGNWSGTMARSSLTVSGGRGTVDGTSGQVVFIRVDK